MQLDDAQRKKVAAWVAEGLKLSEIQNQLSSELGLRMTYMEVRMLVDDLKLVPKDVEPPKSASPLMNAGPSAAAPPAGKPAGKEPAPPPTNVPGGVTVAVDQIARPGAMVSGKVTFSDGNKAEWYFDHNGRLALATQKQGYRPSPQDLQDFQAALDAELSKMGL